MASFYRCCETRSGIKSLFWEKTHGRQAIYECHRSCHTKNHQHHFRCSSRQQTVLFSWEYLNHKFKFFLKSLTAFHKFRGDCQGRAKYAYFTLDWHRKIYIFMHGLKKKLSFASWQTYSRLLFYPPCGFSHSYTAIFIHTVPYCTLCKKENDHFRVREMVTLCIKIKRLRRGRKNILWGLWWLDAEVVFPCAFLCFRQYNFWLY